MLQSTEPRAAAESSLASARREFLQRQVIVREIADRWASDLAAELMPVLPGYRHVYAMLRSHAMGSLRPLMQREITEARVRAAWANMRPERDWIAALHMLLKTARADYNRGRGKRKASASALMQAERDSTLKSNADRAGMLGIDPRAYRRRKKRLRTA